MSSFSEEEQQLRFNEIVRTMRRYEVKYEKYNRFTDLEKIKYAKFLIDQMFKGRKVDTQYKLIEEISQTDFFTDT